MPKMLTLLSLLGFLLFTVGCASPSAITSESANSGTVQTLENQLMNSRWIHVSFDIEAHGAINAHIEGNLWLGSEGESRLVYDGRFAGRPVHLELISDEHVLQQVSGKTWQKARPRHSFEAYVLGFTRMGLLHNIAMSMGGQSPDHGETGVGNWLRLEPHVSTEESFEPAFNIWVDGKKVGHATLTLKSGDTLEPVKRIQMVEFGPNQVMHVTETYRDFTTSRVPPASMFSPRAK